MVLFLSAGHAWGQQKDIASLDIIVTIPELTYTGQYQKVSVTVIDNKGTPDDTSDDITLKEGKDYLLTPNELKEAGQFSLKMIGVGSSYSGTNEVFIDVFRASTNNITLDGLNSSYPFTGTSIKPRFNLYFNGVNIDISDFRIDYGTNRNGQGQILLEPSSRSNFIGSQTISFEINPASTSNLIISPIEVQPYTGRDIKPEPVVTLDGVTLLKDEDYSLIYPDGEYKTPGRHNLYVEPISPSLEGPTMTTYFYITEAPPQQAYTVALQVGAGITSNYSSGNLHVNAGDFLDLTFDTEDKDVTADNILFEVDGVETGLRSFGNGSFRYMLTNIEANHTIRIALREHKVTLPAVENARIIPEPGTYDVASDSPFTFSLVLNDNVDPEQVKVYANGQLLTPDPVRDTTLSFTIPNVTQSLVITVEGIGETTGNTGIPADSRVYSSHGEVIIETAQPQTVQVYSLTGSLMATHTVNGYHSIALQRGVYLVKMGGKVYKVIVNG